MQDGNQPLSLQDALGDLLQGRIAPASDAGTANHMWSTAQFHSYIQEHAPGLVLIESLREVLIGLGYREAFIGDQWLWFITVLE